MSGKSKKVNPRRQPATKMKSRTTIGHIKTMYCFFCQEEQDFVQVD